MKTKTCSYCKKSKPATRECFYHRSDRKALDSRCKKCRRLIANAKYALAHPNMKKYKLKPPKPPAIFRWRPKVGQQFRAYLKIEKIHHEHKFSPFICMGFRGRIVQAEHRRIKFDLNCDKFYFLPIKKSPPAQRHGGLRWKCLFTYGLICSLIILLLVCPL